MRKYWFVVRVYFPYTGAVIERECYSSRVPKLTKDISQHTVCNAVEGVDYVVSVISKRTNEEEIHHALGQLRKMRSDYRNDKERFIDKRRLYDRLVTCMDIARISNTVELLDEEWLI